MSFSASFIETVVIDTATSGDTTLVDISAVAASKSSSLSVLIRERMKIVITSYVVNGSGAVSFKFKSGSTDKTGPMNLAVSGNAIAAGNTLENPLIVCAANEDLIINLDANVQVSGHLSYYIA